MANIDFWLSDNGLTLIRAWSRDGLGRGGIAEKMGITPRTLDKWANKNPSIAEAVNIGSELTDITVENAILKKALGFEVEEVKKVVKANGDEEITTVRKNVPPDISAASVWLKSRRPDKWSERQADGELYTKLDEIIGGIDAQADG